MDQGPGSYIPEEDVSVTSTKLGSGGQGQVYKAVYSGREVALKLAGQTNAEITPTQRSHSGRHEMLPGSSEPYRPCDTTVWLR